MSNPAAHSAIISDSEAEAAYQSARRHLASDDLDGASHWLEVAAGGSHPAALTELAILHLHGFGRDADSARAAELLLAAEQVGGTPETPWLLAQIVLGDIVLPCESRRIDALLADSARRGFPGALRVAGICFGREDSADMQVAATTCLQRAAALRDPVGAALFADRLHAGVGITRDIAGALALAAQLRAMGVPVELPDQPPCAPSFASTAKEYEPPWDRLRVLASAPTIRVNHCEHPLIVTCDNLLGDEECRYLIYSGARFVERSLVVHPQTGQPLEKGLRTSQDMTFVPTHDDVGVRCLQRRMAELGSSMLARCEPLTLLHYGPGEEYRPHRDYFTPSAPQLVQPGGQRETTVCVYLNDVERGGETTFPDCGVSIRPQRGRAVMFRNLHADGRPDPHSLHAGLPVQAGEKWLATSWMRVQPLRAF